MNIKEFGIVFIESLKGHEIKTGKVIYDCVSKILTDNHEGCNAYYFHVNTQKELFKKINIVTEMNSNNRFFPLLHIDSHGSNNGIILANDECVKWDIFLDEIRKLNIKLKNRLFLLLSMCEGFSLIKDIKIDKRAPYGYLVATTKEIKPYQLEHGFKTFYSIFFKTIDPDKAILEMNQIPQLIDNNFFIMSSKDFFNAILNPDREQEAFQRIVNFEAIKLKSDDPKFQNMDFNKVYDFVDNDIRQYFLKKQQTPDYFLMYDI